MSLSQQKIPESKSKSKFQSLNINNLYQGAASKPQSKGLPQKHGLQSLGKVPTARRAPANLPSVKSEKGGNDPTVVLVPTGGGWASKDGEKDGGGVEGRKQEEQGDSRQTKERTDEAVKAASSPPTKPTNQQPLSWAGTVTGVGQGAGGERQQSFLHQKSPLFGQEFPSLRPGEIAPGVMGKIPTDGGDAGGQTGHMDTAVTSDPAYGPGPNLRPQAFANWTQGGKVPTGGPLTEGAQEGPPQVQPHKPVPPQASTARSPATNQYKSIMPQFMEALELPAGPPTSRRQPPRNGMAPRHARTRPSPSQEARPSIIDQDKLQRMDVIDNGDDWTYEDDDFDYNKKLESEDEDTVEPVSAAPSSATESNWAEQMPSGPGKVVQSHPYNFYEEFKQKGGVGFGVDEEEKRRIKKSEEVMKNVERARQRREEEENRYRRGGQSDSDGQYREGHGYRPATSRQGWERDQQQPRRRNYDDRDRFDRERHYESGQGSYSRRDEREDDGWQGTSRRDREGQLWDRDVQQPFDMESDEKRRHDRPPSQARSPGLPPQYQRHDSDVPLGELGDKQTGLVSGSPTWMDKTSNLVQDWVEDVEHGDGRDQYRQDKFDYDQYRDSDGRDYERPNRPASRDSTVSKESRGSKDGKGSRASRDRELGLGSKKEEKMTKHDKDAGKIGDSDTEKKGRPKPHNQDLRGYFQSGVLEGEKKQHRQAPGPITREKLEQAEVKEGMTQLKKRDPNKNEEKVEDVVEKPEVTTTISLIDPDLLENISDDEDNFEGADIEKEITTVSNRGSKAGRGRGGRGGASDGKFASHSKVSGSSRGDRGSRSGRGARVESKRGGAVNSQNKWNESDEVEDVSDERRANKQFGGSGGLSSQWGFMPRGQPSRRGRGDSRGKQEARGGGGIGRGKGFDDVSEEIGEWGDDEMEKKAGGGGVRGKSASSRGQRGKKEGGRPGSGGAEEGEEWETASETSLEEREKRTKVGASSARGGRGNARGRGGQPIGGYWDNKARRGGGQTSAGGSQDAKEGTPELKRAGQNIDNFDVTDSSGVVTIDDNNWSEDQGSGDFGGDMGGDFMQVVNKKGRGGNNAGAPGKERERRNADQRVGERGGGYRGPPNNEMFDKKNSKVSYDKRQNKLPPRLAKQREVSRAQARSGLGQVSPGPGNENGWPDGDKMGVFTVDPDIGTGAWEKPLDSGVKVDNGGIANSGTLIFENTAFKGGKTDKLDKGGAGGAIQLPLSFSKQDSDNGDLKLDFTFGGEEVGLKVGSGSGPPLSSISRSGLPASPSTDDLQTKLANTKKLWDAPGMPVVPENSATTGGSWNESDLYGEGGGDGSSDSTGDKSGPSSSAHNVVSNVAKVKPRQQQQQLGLDSDSRASAAAMHYNRMAVPSPPGTHSGMPPSHMPPSVQPWAFMTDPNNRSTPMYNPYGGLNQQSILMPGAHSMGTDLFNSNNGGFRNVPTFPGSGVGHTTTNNVLISQASLINSHGQTKGSGIGPIGSKAGGGGAGSPYMTSLPNTNSNIFIPHAAYDSSGNPLNYLPGSGPHPGSGRSMPQQTAFYNQLHRINQQQAYNNALQGFAGQHALSQQQLRANAVAGMPFLKTEQAKSPVSIDSGFQSTGGSYNNGRGGGVSGGPPSPKTKMKMAAQQQEHAKINANLNNLNLNANLNANVNLLAQMQMQSGRSIGMGQYGHIGGMVQPGQYNPSPIARPQVSESHSWGRSYELTPPTQHPTTQPVAPSLTTQSGNKQMNQYFSQESGGDNVEETAVSGDKIEATTEGETGTETSSHNASQEAANQPTTQEEAPTQA